MVKIFLPPFGYDLVRPPYVVIDSNLFSMTLSFYFWVYYRIYVTMPDKMGPDEEKSQFCFFAS